MSRRPDFPARSGRRPRAFALIAVLVIVMLASMVAISLLFRVRAEDAAGAAGAGTEQAWAAAMTGVQEAMRVAEAAALSGSLDWRDLPDAFRERLVHDDGADQWRFTVYSAGDPDGPELRFGLTDEASRLNLNQAGISMLAKLPGLKPALAQALWDFLDAGDAPEPEGAEQEYYDALPRPYAVRNGPLASLEEIRLVRGFTPALVFGEDANLNGRLDANEDDGAESFPPDNNDGKLDRGLRGALTAASYDLNQDRDGIPRTNLNDPADPVYTNGLPPSVIDYVAALRRDKVQLRHASELLGAKAKFKDEKGKEVELAAGVGKEELPAVLDLLGTTADEELPGLVNVNTASAAVLAALPEMTESIAESIVASRRGLTPEQRQSPAWIFQEDLVNADVFKAVAPYLTTRSWQFSFCVVGYGLPSGRYRVLEVTIDVAGLKPVVTHLRDLTRLGPPFRFKGEAQPAPARPLAGWPRHSPAPVTGWHRAG